MIDPERIWSSDSLPTLPAVAVRLLDFSRDPETEIDEIVALIRTDPAISAKILRSSNSSFFGFKAKVTSIERAVPLLGVNVVTSLALSFALVDNAMNSGPMAEFFKKYWRQSVVQGCAAEILGDRVEEGLGCETFLTGLLLDIGRLAMLKTIPDKTQSVMELADESRRSLHEVEAEVLGIDHVEVGVRLMEKWGLPATLIEAARRHHDLLADLEGIAEDESLTRIAAVASATGECFCTTNNGPALERLEAMAGRFFGMTSKQVQEYAVRVRDRVDEASELFAIDTSNLGDASDLMAAATEHLAQLAMQAHVASVQAEERRNMAETENRQLEQQNTELKKRTVRDPLTELYNRRYFEEALQNEIERCRRTASPVGLLFSDIDHFKNLNDTYGHQFGDEVLVEVARTFCDVMRKSDVVARFGGEEFVVLVLGPTEKSLQCVAERLRARVESLQPAFEGTPVPVTVSIGAAWAIPTKSDDELHEKLIAEADAAMYEAKHAGRNQVRVRCLLDPFERELSGLITASRFSRWLVKEHLFEIPVLSRLLLKFKPPHVEIGKLATGSGLLDEAARDRVLATQQSRPQCRFGELAHELGLLTVEQIGWLLAQQLEPTEEMARLLVEKGLVEPHEIADLTARYLATSPLAAQHA